GEMAWVRRWLAEPAKMRQGSKRPPGGAGGVRCVRFRNSRPGSRRRHHRPRAQKWLGREDSNLRMREPKSRALPLGHAPPTNGVSVTDRPPPTCSADRLLETARRGSEIRPG